MKKTIKLLILFILMIFVVVPVNAQEVLKSQVSTTNNVARVTSIGQKLLTANKIPAKITFIVSDQDEVNAYANVDNEVHVYKGLLNIVETDDELAAVIAHEIGHIANRHIQKQSILGVIGSAITSKITSTTKKIFVSKAVETTNALSMLKASRSAEYEADLTGADLMIGAGYNPNGMLSLLNKIAQNYIDVIQTHPSGNKRLMNVYDYLSFNYASKIQKGYSTASYKNFKVYADGIVAQRQAEPKKMAAYTKKQTKLRAQKLKRMAAIKNTSNVWATTFNVLQTVSQFQAQ